MGALAGLQKSLDRPVLRIEDLHAVLAGQRDQQALVVGQHEEAGGRLADLDVPLRQLRGEIVGDDAIALLQADEHGLGIGVEGEMARHALDEEPAHELEVGGAIDVDVVEPVGDRHEPFAIGAEAQLIGIDDVADDPALLAGLGVERDQVVRHGRGEQNLLAVRRHRDVMRLAAERQASHLAARGAVDDAVGGLFRIEDENGLGLCGEAPSQPDRQRANRKSIH